MFTLRTVLYYSRSGGECTTLAKSFIKRALWMLRKSRTLSLPSHVNSSRSGFHYFIIYCWKFASRCVCTRTTYRNVVRREACYWWSSRFELWLQNRESFQDRPVRERMRPRGYLLRVSRATVTSSLTRKCVTREVALSPEEGTNPLGSRTPTYADALILSLPFVRPLERVFFPYKTRRGFIQRRLFFSLL